MGPGVKSVVQVVRKIFQRVEVRGWLDKVHMMIDNDNEGRIGASYGAAVCCG